MLLLLLAFPLAAQAQQKLFSHIEIAGGWFVDVDNFEYTDYPSDKRPLQGENNYAGFNYFALGLMGQRRALVYALEVEASKFCIDNLAPIYRTSGSDFDRNKSVIQMNFFFGKESITTKRYQFVWGPILNFKLSKEDHKPTSNFGDNVSQNLKTVGLGVKVKNQFKISEHAKLFLGTRIFMFDLGSNTVTKETFFKPTTTLVEDPKFTFDFLGNHFVLQAGVQFEFYKLSRTKNQNSKIDIPPSNDRKRSQDRRGLLLPPEIKLQKPKEQKTKRKKGEL